MCGRFTLAGADADELAELLGVAGSQFFKEHYRKRYNVAPTDEHWALRLAARSGGTFERELIPAAWGLGKGTQINTRVENARTRTMLADPAAGHRALIPADGFFEWMGEKGNRRPIWFHRADEKPFLFAALCHEASSGFRFSILTTTPNALVANVHDRMPVIVPLEGAEEFLTTKDAKAVATMLKPVANDVLVATEVNKRVNAVGNDDAGCLAAPDAEPVAEESAPKKKQLRLF